MANITIAIDCMGGDFGPSVMIPAIKSVLLNPTYDSVDFQLFGQEVRLLKYLNQHNLVKEPRISVISSAIDVEMTDKPSIALKTKKQSSMRLALESVRDGRAHACVSAGNTGALMAISRFILKMLPGIDRPAIISALPTRNKDQVYLLDLGANVDCNEQRLVQFAIMGNELCKGIDGIDSPKIGLLNVGEEENKGTEKLRNASALINSLNHLNYAGYAEGNQIFTGEYNVIVTDGFTGNSVLKASEGLSLFLIAKIKDAFNKNWWTKLVGLFAKPVINLFKDEIDPERYNGACLIGLRGVVIKSHGSANIKATGHAIEEAILQAHTKVPSKIRKSLEQARQQFEMSKLV